MSTVSYSRNKLIHVMTHPVRNKIIKLLKDDPETLYITQIAKKLDISNRLASFHLVSLLQYGLVDGTWAVSEIPQSPGKAVKHYNLTDKALAIINETKL